MFYGMYHDIITYLFYKKSKNRRVKLKGQGPFIIRVSGRARVKYSKSSHLLLSGGRISYHLCPLSSTFNATSATKCLSLESKY